ncbi:MAG: putative ABC transporter ATP-binding protein YknY [Firmicutes bacterium]|nr:putative ABC transporter ATP-binding protein YknY [candidate division NPL-UPA2 bacterium]
MNKAVELRKVSRTYTLHGNVVRALDEVDLEIPAGILASIVGASGSGKTTLLNVIGGLDRPTSGEIYLHGEGMHALSEEGLVKHRRKLLGYIFQSYNLIPNLSAIENVELPLEFARYPSRERRKRAEQCLQMAELGPARWRHRPAQLSGGEQQRVAIARALANDPKVILADEPTGNLDSKTGKQILKLLRNLVEQEHRTIILISHDSDVAAATDLTAELTDGAVTRIVRRDHSA